MGQLFHFEPLPADYPDHLASPQPELRRLPSRLGLLLLLVVACLLPRAAMAPRLGSICIDGPIYVGSAQALESGNFHGALMEGALNTYPVILMLLHRLGLEWETAAAIWGVIISSLVVLPLWGWVRRQYDDRVALVACLLYIVHPKFINESPEVTRDPTFWFLFALAIYCLWRAVTEVRHGYFLATGAAITLAALTRVEGLFLVILFVLWTFWRARGLRSGRRKLLVGAILCVLVFPALMLLANVAWLHGHVGWTTIRLSPLARVQPWIESLFGLEATAGAIRTSPPTPLGRMLWVFFPTMTRGLAPLFALLMFAGMWGWRRTWARGENQAIFCTCMVVCFGVWVQLWNDNNISRRYALPIVLLSTGFAGLGLLWMADWTQRLSRWLGWRQRVGQAMAALAVAAVLLAGVAHAMVGTDQPRQMAAELGHWLRDDFPVMPVVAGPPAMSRIITYYAHAKIDSYVTLPLEATDATILDLVAKNKAELVILCPCKHLTAERCRALTARLTTTGFDTVRCDTLPAVAGKLYVLVRAGTLQCARKPTPGR